MRVELALDHVARGRGNGGGDLGRQQPLLEIGLGGGELHPRQRMDDLDRHMADADGEIPPRPLRLRAPIGGGRNLYVAEGIVLGSEFGDVWLIGFARVSLADVSGSSFPMGHFGPPINHCPCAAESIARR